MLVAMLVAVRDFLIAAALGWVGITLDRAGADTAREPSAAPPACTSDSGFCAAGKPGFNALDCNDE